GARGRLNDETWRGVGRRSGIMTRPEMRSSASQNSGRHAEAEIAFALDLANQLDLPLQIALARTFAGIGVVRPAPAIIGRVGHRLAAGGERQAGGLPCRGAAIEHADFRESAVAQLG